MVLAMAIMNQNNYHDEQTRQNILKMRAVLETLPSFCRTFSEESRNIPPRAQDLPMLMI